MFRLRLPCRFNDLMPALFLFPLSEFLNVLSPPLSFLAFEQRCLMDYSIIFIPFPSFLSFSFHPSSRSSPFSNTHSLILYLITRVDHSVIPSFNIFLYLILSYSLTKSCLVWHVPGFYSYIRIYILSSLLTLVQPSNIFGRDYS